MPLDDEFISAIEKIKNSTDKDHFARLGLELDHQKEFLIFAIKKGWSADEVQIISELTSSALKNVRNGFTCNGPFFGIDPTSD